MVLKLQVGIADESIFNWIKSFKFEVCSVDIMEWERKLFLKYLSCNINKEPGDWCRLSQL